ncbi:unnamed protein product [Paramecium sonneborni]|uniref:Uncharacterized protein n=1 Tax=Paramecium sonneborni TaxID=65129 RepID=A0A8S1NRW1_9CILI|nr:unnamed protein product [Paramecium sonneborni]
MHNFLFGNRRTNYSSFSPFGSQKNLKPGIISKIKNKIYGLFQPTINQQSLIQRIQTFEDENLEKELSNQFKNNLVLIDRIIPNLEDNLGLKRKCTYPFEQYIKDEFNTDKKQSKQTQTELNNKSSDSQIKTQNVKKQKKFKKNQSKMYKCRKMEENPKQLEFNLNNQKLKQNLQDKYENSSDCLSNQSNKKFKQFDSFSESSIPLKQQKGETSDYLSPVKILENQSIIQNDQKKKQKSDSINKKKESLSSVHSSPNQESVKDDSNKNKNFSNSTGTNTKGEGNETLINFQHGDIKQEVEEKIQEFKQNQDEIFQNTQESNLNQKQEQLKEDKSQIQKQELSIDQTQKKEKNDNKNENLQFQFFEGSNLTLNQLNENKEIIQEGTKIEEQKQLIKNQIFSPSKIKKEQDQTQSIHLQVDECLNRIDKQNSLIEKTSSFQNLQPQQNKEIQKNILQTSFLNNQNKQTIDKNEKLSKEQNPFLVQSPHISYDQISLYFQSSTTSNLNKQCQSQNQNQAVLDLFKISTQSPQKLLNKTQEKFNSQNLQQTNNNFGNPKVLQYSVNKQMEIIEQSPQINQIIQNQQQIFEQTKLNYQQQPTLQNNLFQQQQQQQQQHYPQQLIQQQSFQLQNSFPLQQHTSNQVSSLNLFQTNSFQQQQNEIMNNPLHLKNDVLSLFQDTKKSDRDIFQTQQYQQTSQSLNNSFNKGRKKQRINNF